MIYVLWLRAKKEIQEKNIIILKLFVLFVLV